MAKLTKLRVEAFTCPEGKDQAFLWDTETRGFGVRVTKGGSRSYVVQGYPNGKMRRTTIGPHGVFTCDQAREQARGLLQGMRLGVDPKEEKKRKVVEGVTLREVMADYLRDRTLKPSSRADIEKHVGKSFADWADQPARAINRDMCADRFRALSKTGPAQANLAFRNLRALLNYARAKYRAADGVPTMPENPVSVLSETKVWNRETPKSRRIPNPKIGAVWSMLQAHRDSDNHAAATCTSADIVAFLLLTGARWSEAAELSWDRVNLDESWWHLPEPKNHNAVTLPLSTAAKSLLAGRPKLKGNPYVFASRSGKGNHVKDARGMMAKVSALAGLHLSPHDLRRTFIAVSHACGVEMWKAELLTNHIPNTVTLMHYTDTNDLRYLAPEAQLISDWIHEQAKIDAEFHPA